MASLIFSVLPSCLALPFSSPPQLTAQKHKNSKYGVWHIEACRWSLSLPGVHLGSEADTLCGGCQQNLRKVWKGQQMPREDLTTDKSSEEAHWDVFISEKKSRSNLWISFKHFTALQIKVDGEDCKGFHSEHLLHIRAC